MTRTPYKMVTYAFHSLVKRGRNGIGTRNGARTSAEIFRRSAGAIRWTTGTFPLREVYAFGPDLP